MSLPSAIPIAFNRRLRASWLRDGLRLLANGADSSNWIESMESLVRETTSGKDSVTKSMRYLRHVWIEPGSNDALRSSAITLYRSSPTENSSVMLSWGMAIATYPFLNEVAMTVGRILRVQSELKLEQLLRKLTESFGERETVRRSGRYALGLMTDFGFVKRTNRAGCYALGQPLRPDSNTISGWFVRAWFSATDSSAIIDRVVMTGSPSLAFFDSSSIISDSIESGVLIPERLSFSQDVLRMTTN